MRRSWVSTVLPPTWRALTDSSRRLRVRAPGGPTKASPASSSRPPSIKRAIVSTSVRDDGGRRGLARQLLACIDQAAEQRLVLLEHARLAQHRFDQLDQSEADPGGLGGFRDGLADLGGVRGGLGV